MLAGRTGSCSLVSSKEEQLVLQDRSAQRSAELVPLEVVAFQRKKVSGIESVIANELKCVAVKFIRARLRNCVDLAARSSASSGGGAATDLHLELLKRIRKRNRHLRAIIGVVVHRSIEGIHHSELESPGYGNEISRSARAANKASRHGTARSLCSRARKRDEVSDSATVRAAVPECAGFR